MNSVLLVAAGGALGSVARHGLNSLVMRQVTGTFPFGILAVNSIGCFLMGVLAALFLRLPSGQDHLRLLLATGFLGGFTTFSAFALDTLKLAQAGQVSSAVTYVATSVIASLAATFIGFALVRAVV